MFEDYEPGGSLCVVLQTCFIFKYSQDWRRFDFASEAKRDKNIELFEMIETALLVHSFISTSHLQRNPDT
jgi:hypothetical protein